MSLTGYINSSLEFSEDVLKLPDTYLKGFKNMPNKYVKKISWSKSIENLINDNEKFLNLVGFIGTEFDYLARVIISWYLNGNETKFFENFIPNDWIDKFIENFEYDTPEDCKYVRNIYDNYINIVKTFINHEEKKLTLKDIFLPCYTFSKIEHYYRNGRNLHDFPTVKSILMEYNDDIDKEIYRDIYINEIYPMEQLFCNNFIKAIDLKKDSNVIFNPSFGICSNKIGGADADIFIDGTLYDFKTTNSSKQKDKDLKQLYGYYLLWRVAKNCREKTSFGNNQITKLAFYKARFGKIEYIDISQIDNNDLNASISKMTKYLNNLDNYDNIIDIFLRLI